MGRWNCAVPLCSNRKCNVGRHITWHAFPNNPSLRKQWIVKIRRDIGKDFTITNNTRVCSSHFKATDFRALLHSKRKYLLKEAIPSIFPWTNSNQIVAKENREIRIKKRQKQKCRSNLECGTEVNYLMDNNESDNNEDDNDKNITDDNINNEEVCDETINSLTENNDDGNALTTEKDCCKNANSLLTVAEDSLSVLQLKYQNALNELQQKDKIIQCLKHQIMKYKHIKHDAKLVNFYTGLPSGEIFNALLKFLTPKANKCIYWSGKRTKTCTKYQVNPSCQKPGMPSKLDNESMLLLVLIRLKLGTPVLELARQFGISISTVNRIFTTWITLMYYELTDLCSLPPVNIIKKSNPPQFVEYPDTTLIIDCTEIKIQRPFLLHTQRETFSSYKHGNTFKILLGITPAGFICFVSGLHGGAISDKAIVEASGFLDKLTPGHSVMADKGFEIESILPPNVTLNLPPKFFRSKAPQMPENDVNITRKIAKVRVHVERAIRRVRTYTILNHTIPLNLTDVANQIFTVCAYLCNLKPALLKPSEK